MPPQPQGPHMSSNEAINNFVRYVDTHMEKCRDSDGNDVQYIPKTKLVAYWQEQKVRQIFELCQPPIFQTPGTIINEYIIVFSILVYISNPYFISHCVRCNLTDIHLPLRTGQGGWPADPASLSLFKIFDKHQWRFCPLQFESGKSMHKRELDARQVLPVVYEDRLSQTAGDGDIAIVWKVKIHDSCNNLVDKGKYVVFKVYQTEEARDLFSNEADAYTTLFAPSFDYIVRYLGSFEQNGKFTVILEYAEGGSLLDFLKKGYNPIDNEELVKFWTRMFELLWGLHCIHEISKPDGATDWILEGIHNDIQPVNILVFPGESGSLYDSHFKLADFGTSHITKRLARDKYPRSRDNDGNRIYTAPECCPIYPIQDTVRNKIERSADVWALGAVFSEVLVWTIQGERGRENYRKRRVAATAQIPALAGSGYDACFHNGSERLSVVEQVHQDVLKEKRTPDTISPFVSELVLDHMLQRRDKARLSAWATYHTAQGKLDKGKRASLPQGFTTLTPPTTPEAAGPAPSTPRPSRSQTTSTAELRSGSWNQARPPPIAENSETTTELGDLRPLRDRNASSLNGRALTMPIITAAVAYQSGRFDQTSNNQQHVSVPDSSSSANTTSNPDRSSSVAEHPETENTGGEQAPSSQSISNTQNGLSGGVSRKVTIEEVYALLKKKNKLIFGRKNALTQEILNLPGIPNALSKIRTIKGREQIILVDDFSSMRRHKHKATLAARVLSYYVKEVDPNEMELYFASNLSKPLKFEKSSAIENAVENHDFVEGTCNMSHCLNVILEPIYNSFLRKYDCQRVSIYILTDGVWEPGDPKVDKIIDRTVRKLKTADLPQDQVMFQFLRFGDGQSKEEQEGKERLTYLDDEIVEKFKLGDYDIVDTRHCDDSVPDILIGSISSSHDDNNNNKKKKKKSDNMIGHDGNPFSQQHT